MRFSIVVSFLLAPSQCFFDLIMGSIVCHGYCCRLHRDKRIVALIVHIDIASAAFTVSDSVYAFPPLADVAVDVDVDVDEDLLYWDEDKSDFGCLWCGRRNCHPCGLLCGLMWCGAVFCVTSYPSLRAETKTNRKETIDRVVVIAFGVLLCYFCSF